MTSLIITLTLIIPAPCPARGEPHPPGRIQRGYYTEVVRGDIFQPPQTWWYGPITFHRRHGFCPQRR